MMENSCIWRKSDAGGTTGAAFQQARGSRSVHRIAKKAKVNLAGEKKRQRQGTDSCEKAASHLCVGPFVDCGMQGRPRLLVRKM